jgi:hypothetical protein
MCSRSDSRNRAGSNELNTESAAVAVTFLNEDLRDRVRLDSIIADHAEVFIDESPHRI